MNAAENSRRLDTALAELRESAKVVEPPPLGSPTLVVRTKSLGAYPTAASRFFACEPVTILGPETEGSAGLAYPSGTTLYAYNLGASTPPQSTHVIASFVNHRWVFRYEG